MSIQEEIQLIIQSGTIGKGGEIILLEMGKSIKIDQLACDLIKLSGLIPGEKLYEELKLKTLDLIKASEELDSD